MAPRDPDERQQPWPRNAERYRREALERASNAADALDDIIKDNFRNPQETRYNVAYAANEIRAVALLLERASKGKEKEPVNGR